MLKPDWEKAIFDKNPDIEHVIGVDEVGRGCWAGPLMFAAVRISRVNIDKLDMPELRDSKKILRSRRESIHKGIRSAYKQGQLDIKLITTSAAEISKIGLAEAIRQSLSAIAIEFGGTDTEFCLDGALKLKGEYRWQSVVKGDDKIFSIAAASNYAKVERDNYMRSIADQYPHFKFEKNVGYGTLEHRIALEKYGPVSEHRMNYKPVIRAMEQIQLL
jgi:ribonuclease HII